MKLNIFFRLEKAWVGTRQKLVSSLNYVFCFGENLNLHYVKQNEKPTHAIWDLGITHENTDIMSNFMQEEMISDQFAMHLNLHIPSRPRYGRIIKLGRSKRLMLVALLQIFERLLSTDLSRFR